MKEKVRSDRLVLWIVREVGLWVPVGEVALRGSGLVVGRTPTEEERKKKKARGALDKVMWRTIIRRTKNKMALRDWQLRLWGSATWGLLRWQLGFSLLAELLPGLART